MKPPQQKKERQQRLKPMLAQLIEKAFDSEEWVFEVKFDGYRALALIDGKGKVDLYSRNFISFNERYQPLIKELEKIQNPVILDGEIVLEDKKGVSRFQLLQNFQKSGEGVLKYYVFDLLHLNGHSTRDLPLTDRKDLLKLILKKSKLDNILFSDHVRREGQKFFRVAQKKKLEGIIAKKAWSLYNPGKRNGDWRKIKITNEQEAIILGVTEPQGTRKGFGSLILGAYQKGQLCYIGNAGTGFSDALLNDLLKKFKPYFRTERPLKEIIKTKGKIQWMKPHFVCEIRFSEWTDDRHMRHPVFIGLRVDKKPAEVNIELPKK